MTDKPDSGLIALAGVAAFFRIPADPASMRRDLGLFGDAMAEDDDVVRAARRIGLRAAIGPLATSEALLTLPDPTILRRKDGRFIVFGGHVSNEKLRVIDPVSRVEAAVDKELLFDEIRPTALRLTRRFSLTADTKFGLNWFLPSIWRYRRPLAHVLIASLFVQIFALVTPFFFQVVVDKVLVHHSMPTLTVLFVGLVVVGIFDVGLQLLRSWALSHTTNRIDVELGRRLFHHLLRLPLGYFETRSVGQTVARVRELETIRSFLTGQGLFFALDLLFAFGFIGILFLYSIPLTLIVLTTIPVFILITTLVRPILRARIKEKFERGAMSQQFLVETVVGMQTVKAAAVEPIMQAEWEERLAAYVKTAFDVTLIGAAGQNAIQYVSKLSTALIIFWGAKQVIDGDMTVGQLVAFNMISAQIAQPIIRISQLFQDFQQVHISMERLGDILDAPIERAPRTLTALPVPRGAIDLRNVSFRYRPELPEVLRRITLSISPGEVIGFVGPSGSGKSTLTKLVQRFYLPDVGQVLIDGMDLAQVDPAWLRRHIGVVLQENLLFNRTIHENIAFSDPALSRARVAEVARMAGADEFISRLPEGYDTLIEERGANLSGGQRQRIAIARALACNPPILIFDEATSALDYESERVIQNNMRRIVEGRTVLVIAHRLAAVRGCDRIVGMVEGEVVEVGSHAELLSRPGGLYAHLWSLQNDGTKP